MVGGEIAQLYITSERPPELGQLFTLPHSTWRVELARNLRTPPLTPADVTLRAVACPAGCSGVQWRLVSRLHETPVKHATRRLNGLGAHLDRQPSQAILLAEGSFAM
ncbi:hypothetical protein GJAV_G00144410 [Gymnothorax javanicus]|nr:hypothetical protein GJAV_G00144410 [Gymnothorax javanicus]